MSEPVKMDGELLKGLLKMAPGLIGAMLPAPGRPLEVRVELDPGPEAEKIKKIARALSERTRVLPHGVETLKLAKPGAAETFMGECRKVGIDMDAVKERLRVGAPRGPMLPVEQIVQLTRRLSRGQK